MSAKLLTIRDQAHFSDIVSSADNLLCIMFTASWCQPCRQAYPEVRRMSYEFAGDASFLTVDADDNGEIVQMCKVRAFPTFMFVHKGKQLDFVMGANIEGVEAKTRRLLKEIRAAESDAGEKSSGMRA